MRSIKHYDNAFGLQLLTHALHMFPQQLEILSNGLDASIARIRKSLEVPYTGPFDVLCRHKKFFIIKLLQG